MICSSTLWYRQRLSHQDYPVPCKRRTEAPVLSHVGFLFYIKTWFHCLFFFSFPEPPTHALDVIQSFFHVQKLQRWRLTEHAHINIISSESQGKRTHVNRLPAITAQMHWMESPLVWFPTTGTKTNQHCLLNWFSSLLL